MGAEGVHVGHVAADSAIGDDKIIERCSEYAKQLGDEGVISIEGIQAWRSSRHSLGHYWPIHAPLKTANPDRI